MHYRIFSTWRLVAALAIMLYHFAHHGPPGSMLLVERIELMLPMLDMFFIISGFLIFEAYRDKIGNAREYASYIARRFARIYPLHIITLAFFVAVGIAGHFGYVKTGGAARYDLSQLLPNLLLMQAWGVTRELSLNYVSWSLSAEWFCYLLLPLIVLFFRYGGAAGLLALFAMTVAILETLSATGVVPFKSWLMADTWGAYRAFADFTMGAFIAAAANGSRMTLRSHCPAWLTMLSAIVTMQLKWPPYLGYGLVAAALYLAAVCERNAPERSRWLDFAAPAATVSFGIYMWHPVIETLTFHFVWPRLVAPLGINFYAFLPLPMAVSVLIAWASYHSLERWTGRWLAWRLGALANSRRARLPAAGE